MLNPVTVLRVGKATRPRVINSGTNNRGGVWLSISPSSLSIFDKCETREASCGTQQKLDPPVDQWPRQKLSEFAKSLAINLNFSPSTIS